MSWVRYTWYECDTRPTLVLICPAFWNQSKKTEFLLKQVWLIHLNVKYFFSLICMRLLLFVDVCVVWVCLHILKNFPLGYYRGPKPKKGFNCFGCDMKFLMLCLWGWGRCNKESCLISILGGTKQQWMVESWSLARGCIIWGRKKEKEKETDLLTGKIAGRRDYLY